MHNMDTGGVKRSDELNPIRPFETTSMPVVHVHVLCCAVWRCAVMVALFPRIKWREGAKGINTPKDPNNQSPDVLKINSSCSLHMSHLLSR